MLWQFDYFYLINLLFDTRTNYRHSRAYLCRTSCVRSRQLICWKFTCIGIRFAKFHFQRVFSYELETRDMCKIDYEMAFVFDNKNYGCIFNSKIHFFAPFV